MSCVLPWCRGRQLLPWQPSQPHRKPCLQGADLCGAAGKWTAGQPWCPGAQSNKFRKRKQAGKDLMRSPQTHSKDSAVSSLQDTWGCHLRVKSFCFISLAIFHEKPHPNIPHLSHTTGDVGRYCWLDNAGSSQILPLAPVKAEAATCLVQEHAWSGFDHLKEWRLSSHPTNLFQPVSIIFFLVCNNVRILVQG